MVAGKTIDRANIHQAIDRLETEDLTELASFIAYLEYRSRGAGKDWFEKVYDLFAPVRQAVEESGMSETEVDAVIDDAIEAVRRERST